MTDKYNKQYPQHRKRKLQHAVPPPDSPAKRSMEQSAHEQVGDDTAYASEKREAAIEEASRMPAYEEREKQEQQEKEHP